MAYFVSMDSIPSDDAGSPHPQFDIPDPCPNPFEQAAEREACRNILAAIRELPQRQKAVMLCLKEGYSCREICERLGISRQAVNKLLKKGRLGVRARLGWSRGKNLTGS